jgi:Kef-type K+ transport system membrane component KefB
MTATSIGITASVFGELKMLRSREGQIVIGAAVLDDILGIVILAVVVSLAGGGQPGARPILKLVAGGGGVRGWRPSASAARLPPLFDWLIDRLKAPGDVVVACVRGAHPRRFAATAIGLEAALGAFAAGPDPQQLEATAHAIDAGGQAIWWPCSPRSSSC